MKTISPLEYFDKLFPADGGVNLFAVNNDGETMLHVIARRAKARTREKNYDAELFRTIMDKGLDPLRENARGRSALDVASAYEKEIVICWHVGQEVIENLAPRILTWVWQTCRLLVASCVHGE